MLRKFTKGKSCTLSLILWLALWHVHSEAQPQIDSLQKPPATLHGDTAYVLSLLRRASNLRNKDIDSAKFYFRRCVELSKKSMFIKGEVRAFNGLAICHGILAEYAAAIESFKSALSLARTHNLPLHAGDSYNGLGIVYKRLGDYPNSLTSYSKALQLYDSLNHDLSSASSFENMGILYDLMKDTTQAMVHYQKALDIYNKNSDERSATVVRSNIAVLYLNNNKVDQSIPILAKNLSYYTSNDMRRYETEEAMNLGTAYLKVHRYKDSEEILIHALSRARESGLEQIQVEALNALSQVRANLGKYSAAIRDGMLATTIAKKSGSLALKSNAFKSLSYAYEKSGDMDRALASLKMHQNYEDSVFNEHKSQAFMHQQVLLQVRDKDEQIKDQSIQLTLLDKEVMLETRWKLTMGAALILLLIAGTLYYQKYRTKIGHIQEVERQNLLIRDQNEEIEAINHQLNQQIVLRKETDDTINYFATSLFGKNTIDEILWDVAKNCISRLGFVDCVIYLVDRERGVLMQKAAYGTKNPLGFSIQNPIEIPLGEGIVGAVASNGEAEMVNDTSQDARYIIDDEARNAELAVPLIIQKTVIGVIDTEHPEKNFFTLYHLESLTTIAAICSSKISQAEADIKDRSAREMQREAAQIRELDKIKSQFFANISHEFRTPLNLILAPLSKTDPLTLSETRMMSRNARRLLRLVNQLLDLAKIEVGLLETKHVFVNVLGFVSDVAHSFTLSADARNTEYKIDIPAHDVIAAVDADKLEKIIYNLLSNAFKFTPNGGMVSIAVTLSNGELHITVSDNGVGVPAELHDKIFDRFYQVDSTQTRSYEGSGIGLSLTKELVDLLGGTIKLKSQQGTGCHFDVVIPLPQADIATDELQMTPLQLNHYYTGQEGERVSPELLPDENPELPLLLYVEDNNELREYIRMILAPKYNVLVAPNGAEGCSIAEQRVPDLIVTDIMMPLMDGVSLTRKLRSDEKTNHIPIILLTARNDIESRISGFETGAEQYVVKPFDIAELLARIQGLLDRQERLKKKFAREVYLQPSDVAIPDRDAQFLQKLVACIEQYMTEKSFSVDQLQKEVGMSRMQLHRKLKALTNQSAGDLIRTIRLKRATQLLTQPGMQVAEAAFLSGFNNLSYFSKCYKEQYGILPSEVLKTTSNT